MKNKISRRNVIYAIIWGAGLFFSTYMSAICDGEFSAAFKDVVKCILVPAYIVLALFLWDEAENIDLTPNTPPSQMKNQLRYNFITLGVVVILIGLAGMAENIVWQMVLLILGWIGITLIKFWSLHFTKLQIEINKVP